MYICHWLRVTFDAPLARKIMRVILTLPLENLCNRSPFLPHIHTTSDEHNCSISYGLVFTLFWVLLGLSFPLQRGISNSSFSLQETFYIDSYIGTNLPDNTKYTKNSYRFLLPLHFPSIRSRNSSQIPICYFHVRMRLRPRFSPSFLLDVKLPYEPSCPSVGRSVGPLVGWSVIIS